MFPPDDELKICFAHVAYQLQERFLLRQSGIDSFGVRTPDDFAQRIGEADVVVVSGMWRNELLDQAPRLRFIQSIGAGTDQFDRGRLTARGIRLASAQGVNANAVSEHAMALILALARKLPEARDNQARHVWRGMISDIAQREDELGGKTLLIVGLGGIGSRLARLAKAFGMRVVGIKRDPFTGGEDADSVHALAELKTLLPDADFVALTCPLTKETEKIIDGDALALMKKSACLVNVARGRCVDELALLGALQGQAIAGAAIDVTAEEPLPPASPLWDLTNVLITPHTAGETRKYEDNVLDILVENLHRLATGESSLKNQIV
ncbi:MAG: D-2-hydroxyacid dehydrogenase [Betaproteobacteria bacterium]|nr:D-2-hydroxyacid dehydrogenase [Betaproteobacteria bacterium]